MPRIEELKYVNISSVLDFQADRLRWCYKWIENRVPRETPVALSVGKMVHAAFEDHFKNGTPLDHAMEAQLPKQREQALMNEKEWKAIQVVEGLVEPIRFWKDDFPIEETLEIEEPFQLFLTSGARFVGRPDRVVRAYGKIWHMQHKTIGAQMRMDTYLTLARRSLHELMYALALGKKYKGVLYGGTIYNVIRKLKYRSKQKTKAEPDGKILHTPDEMFLQTTIGYDTNEIADAYDEVNAISVAMDRTLHAYLEGALIPANRLLDGGRYGRLIDPYTLVMLGEADLYDDEKFMDRNDTYEEEAANEDEEQEG